jgi:tetratricopeptide (TPR) repeat protein
VLLVVALRAGEPPEKFDAVKPAWQRLLQGEDAKKAAEQETKLAQLQEAGQFPEALKVAEALAELRAKRQGADHSQAVDARLVADAIRRVLNAKPEERKSYSTVFAIKREVEALNAKGRYREAQPFLERDLSIHRKVLGEEHPLTAMCYNEVARNLYARGKYAEAAEVDSKALTIRRKVLGEDHPDTATSYNNVAFNL